MKFTPYILFIQILRSTDYQAYFFIVRKNILTIKNMSSQKKDKFIIKWPSHYIRENKKLYAQDTSFCSEFHFPM